MLAFGRHLIRLGNFVVWSANGRDYRKIIANAAYIDITQRM